MSRERALDAIHAAVVAEEGTRWGEQASETQKRDMASLFDPAEPRFQIWTRPRGGGKTSDLGLAMAAALRFTAGPSDRMYAAASDRDQAALIVDSIAGLVRRTPALRGLEVSPWKVTAPSGASLTVLAADGAGAYGLTPSWVALDEFFFWPDSAAHRTFWTAISSALGKRPDAKLTVISTPGDPNGWTAEVYRHAEGADLWRTSHMPGPLRWANDDYLGDEKQRLMPSTFARLHLAWWAEGEEALTASDDISAACTLAEALPYEAGRRYSMGVDLGLVHDATGLAVGHTETIAEGEPPRVVIDRVARWQGSRADPVELAEIEAYIEQCRESYRSPGLWLDPWQSVGMAQRLRARGMQVKEFAFSVHGTSRLAGTLFTLLRGRRIVMPKEPLLVDELRRTKLIETSPGRFKMETPRARGSHGDLVVAVGLCALALLEKGSPRAPHSVNRRDVEYQHYRPVLERAGLRLEGRRYLDRQRERDGLVPPPGWTRRTAQ